MHDKIGLQLACFPHHFLNLLKKEGRCTFIELKKGNIDGDDDMLSLRHLTRRWLVVQPRPLIQQRASVWHAGFEHEKEAQDLKKQIQRLQTNGNNTTKEDTTLVQQLIIDYEEVTGEKYDDDASGRRKKKEFE